MNICVQQSLVELWVDRDRRAGVHQASMPAQPEVLTDKNDPDVRDDEPPSQPQDRGDETCKRMLSSVIQKQIIPRLLQSEPKHSYDPESYKLAVVEQVLKEHKYTIAPCLIGKALHPIPPLYLRWWRNRLMV